MLVSEYTNLEALVTSICDLIGEETAFKDSVYYCILYYYGNKTLYNPINHIDTSILAEIIYNKYRYLWAKIKEMQTTETPLTTHTNTETTENNIYGYNSETGVKDYTLIKTYSNEYEDIYSNYKKCLDFFRRNNYYSIVTSCIVNFITLSIYESEV